MGTRVGHALPGLGFFLIGLWQLFNHTKLYCRHPKSYHPPIWFPMKKIKYLELYLIMWGSGTYIIMELFVGPSNHHPLDPIDFTIPTSHLHNFEHATITFAMFICAFLVYYLDTSNVKFKHNFSFMLASFVFLVEFFIFYLHSTDHVGLEWQYHKLLILIICACFISTLMDVGFPRSFALGFIRSVSIGFHGLWSMILGIMLYTPRLLPKGCHLKDNDGFLIIPCDDHLSLHRAKGLVNLEFTWALISIMALSVWFYLFMAKKYPEADENDTPAEKVNFGNSSMVKGMQGKV